EIVSPRPTAVDLGDGLPAVDPGHLGQVERAAERVDEAVVDHELSVLTRSPDLVADLAVDANAPEGPRRDQGGNESEPVAREGLGVSGGQPQIDQGGHSHRPAGGVEDGDLCAET